MLVEIETGRMASRHSGAGDCRERSNYGASAARDLVRRSRKFISDFPRLRLLDDPRFQRDGIIASTHEKAIRQPCAAISLIYTVALPNHAVFVAACRASTIG